jgi:hypothetical protein
VGTEVVDEPHGISPSSSQKAWLVEGEVFGPVALAEGFRERALPGLTSPHQHHPWVKITHQMGNLDPRSRFYR